MPYLFNIIAALLLTFFVANQQVIIKIDDQRKVEIKVKKDEIKLNKTSSHTSNRYANNEDTNSDHIEDFL